MALDRLSRLQEWQNQASDTVLASMKGQEVVILLEGKSRWNVVLEEGETVGEAVPLEGEGEAWQGKTPQGFIVNVNLSFRSGENIRLGGWEGAMLPVSIEAAARHSLKGRQAGAPW